MAAQDYTVHLRKGIKFSMTAVATEEKEDVELYERRTYRDEITGGYLGNPDVIFQTEAFDSAATVTHDLEAPLAECDSYKHVAPRHEMIKRTRYIWKNAGTDILGWAWADEIVSIAVGAPTRF